MSIEDIALEETAHYHWYAERYGWTPAEVDDLPAKYRDRFPTVAAVFDEVAEEKAKRDAKQ